MIHPHYVDPGVAILLIVTGGLFIFAVVLVVLDS